MKLSPNMIGNSDDETNFPHQLLLIKGQVANLRKTFANNLLTDVMLSTAQLSKTKDSGGFLGKLLGPLLKTGVPLMKKYNKTISLECFDSIKINCSSISSRCWNT